MPSRNVIKRYGAGHVYHVYNRGNDKKNIFVEEADFAVFLALLRRHLSKDQTADRLGRPYKNYYDTIELLAFCLMPNHFHLLLYQETETAITQLMRSISISYAGYFNKKYGRVGYVFQGIFKASLIDNHSYWCHISRYIHLNPADWRTWEWSSLPYYLGEKRADWVRPDRLFEVFEGEDYADFVADYETHKAMLDELKHLLAN